MQEKRLEVFLAIAMSRTFGKAADTLNVSPSSISRELKNLEDEVGMLLVDRQKGVKSVRLTPAGEAFLPLVLKWQEIKKELANPSGIESPCFLSVAGSEVVNNNLLPQLFINLLGHNPPVHLKIGTDPTDMLYEKIAAREIDVGFVVHQEPSRFVKIKPIYRDDMMIARLENGEIEAGESGKTIPLEELNAADELYIEWSQEFRLWHDSIWDPAVSVPIQLLSPYLVPRLMTAPGQWAVLPSCTMSLFEGSGKRVRWYRFDPGTPHMPKLTVYQLTHRNPKLSALKGLEILEEVLDEMDFRNL